MIKNHNHMQLTEPAFTVKFLTILSIALFVSIGAKANLKLAKDSSIAVALGGNGWLNNGAQAVINEKGLTNWVSDKDVITVYLRPETTGNLNIALKLLVPDGKSVISIVVGKKMFSKTVSNKDTAIVKFGNITIDKAGYISLKLQGVSKTGKEYALVTDVIANGTSLAKGAAYVKNNQGNYYYWGHRGPSVHLNYEAPEEAKNNIEWFYNEVTVPVGEDVLGSYFMADGFTGGYFGMQVNSPTERHVLFSIWSPFVTDDPKGIPDS